jgi:uncharacterized protein YdhG (YjbR/CyaY superfamily)
MAIEKKQPKAKKKKNSKTKLAPPSKRSIFKNMDAYIKSAQPESRTVLEEIRRVIGKKFPEAKETISYQIPAFSLGRNFIYFAAFKYHIGIYPPIKKDKALIKALALYRGPKGNLQFPLNEPMPYKLIEKVAMALAREYASMDSKQPKT